ncbi:Uncharacterized protein A9P81_0007 [Leptospira interrogans serovar Copenhageni/Icterohaemorrhagiae]|nr:Uncharacterized protein A9P81_0007 [Leptospira interrogans serovar Copenhageni/Icterohaemorrhagiae]
MQIIDKLKEHLLHLPNKYKFIKFELASIIDSYNFKTFKEINFLDSAFDKAHAEFVIKLKENKVRYTSLMGNTHLINNIASMILRIIENRIILLELLVESIKNLFITILFSMLVIYFSQIVPLNNILHLLFSLFLIYLMIFSLYVIFSFIRSYYSSLSRNNTMKLSHFPSPNFVSSLRSRSLMRLSLRAKATLLCHFGSRDATKVARISCQPHRANALAAATSRRLFR